MTAAGTTAATATGEGTRHRTGRAEGLEPPRPWPGLDQRSADIVLEFKAAAPARMRSSSISTPWPAYVLAHRGDLSCRVQGGIALLAGGDEFGEFGGQGAEQVPLAGGPADGERV
jgi:hypothetical protein